VGVVISPGNNAALQVIKTAKLFMAPRLAGYYFYRDVARGQTIEAKAEARD